MTPNLETGYLGLRLEHPIVASAGPLTHNLDGFRKLEDGGAAAIVMHSLFEEEIMEESQLTDHFLDYGAETFGESLTYLPELQDYNVGPDAHLSLLAKAKDSLEVPIIGSLNGVTPGGWGDYATEIQQAGADALELNIYNLATDPEISAAEVEELYLQVVREVRAKVTIPLAVKLSSFFSAPAHMIRQLAEAGANAVVLFNRFYQPDFDLEHMEVTPNLVLSSPAELRLPLRWVALLHGRISIEFAITSGVHSGEDVLKGLMAGANAVMTNSEILRRGPSRIAQMVGEMSEWMSEHEYESVSQMLGALSQRHSSDPSAYERANYRKVLQSWQPHPSLGHLGSITGRPKKDW